MPRLQPFGPPILRLALGAVFVAHGAQKVFGLWGGTGLSGTAAFFSELGLTPAYPLALLVGLVELAGGLLLAAGAFTLIAAAVLGDRHERGRLEGPSSERVLPQLDRTHQASGMATSSTSSCSPVSSA